MSEPSMIPSLPTAAAPVIPYATPALYQQQAMASQGVWQDGKLLLCVREIVLPNHCCVKCDQPADGKPLRKRFSWHHPALALLILVAILIYVIVALIVRKNATVVIPLCRRHRARRDRSIWIALALLFGGIAAIVASIALEIGWIAGLGCLSMLASAIVAIAGTQTISPKKIDDHYAWFKGASRAYLSALPQIYHQ